MEWILQLPVLFFSVIFHEFAHGYAAYRRGDDTAYLSGRLSFNPLPHIDPVGTLILPAACILMGFPAMGWAKPVPVNPYRLHSPRSDMAMVALSGPLSNITLAVIGVLAIKIMAFAFSGSSLQDPFMVIFIFTIQINLLLAIFNLIPIFPLDGSQIMLGLLKGRALELYEKHLPYGMYIILGLVVTGLLQVVLRPILILVTLVIYRVVGAF
ncbi:MAG: site-2 protease family protein [Elusimicrobia bacterium]|nr:site-2 protease family protein [Elusimicrobiota bacterium]